MILKSFELNKINLDTNKYILFYGKNEYAKNEEILKIIDIQKEAKTTRYDEKQIFDNSDIFFNNILSKSLFEDKKIIIISRATDRIIKIIEELFEKNITDISLIINADNLEKRSKLRSLFEKKKELICVPFYPDTPELLIKYAQNFLKKNNISVSQSNINLIINRSNGDRGALKIELEKIELFIQNNKKLTTENILKLTNLFENFSVSELVDNCLAKNKKKTINIFSENNFSNDDCILITRTFLSKSKKILYLSKEYKKNQDINKTISNAKPPIFWKDKEIVKQQIYKWNTKEINNLIFDINKIELQIKKNSINPLNIISNFILEKAS
jgi:DNA polymerase-3 subunit delta